MNEGIEIFKALADEIRLRILRTLSATEVSVAELVEVLSLPQSTVSRHLKPLRETDLVETRREGTSVFYRRGPAFRDPSLERLLEKHLDAVPHKEADARTVESILDRRRQNSRTFFDQIAGEYASLAEPGGGWACLAAGLAAGFAGLTVADLGAGEGVLSLILARYAETVIAVDQSPPMIRLIEEKAREKGAHRIFPRVGELEALPIDDASCDAVFLSQSLHHAARPDVALKEASRILKEGGRLILLDLVRHEQEWMRNEWADVWLGFDAREIRTWMKQVGLILQDVPVELERSAGIPVLLAHGIKQ